MTSKTVFKKHMRLKHISSLGGFSQLILALIWCLSKVVYLFHHLSFSDVQHSVKQIMDINSYLQKTNPE